MFDESEEISSQEEEAGAVLQQALENGDKGGYEKFAKSFSTYFQGQMSRAQKSESRKSSLKELSKKDTGP